jgi:hypothetical protein
MKEEPKQEWKAKEGEEVWIKVFSNWSSGKYIGYDVDKKTHLVRETEEGGGHLFISSHILPYSVLPNEPKQETLEEAAEWLNKKFDGKGVEIKIIDWGKNEKYNYPPSILLEEYAKYQSERMYSENEVRKLLETQRGNCYVAILTKTKDKELAEIANNAPEPSGYNGWVKQFKK